MAAAWRRMKQWEISYSPNINRMKDWLSLVANSDKSMQPVSAKIEIINKCCAVSGDRYWIWLLVQYKLLFLCIYSTHTVIDEKWLKASVLTCMYVCTSASLFSLLIVRCAACSLSIIKNKLCYRLWLSCTIMLSTAIMWNICHTHIYRHREKVYSICLWWERTLSSEWAVNSSCQQHVWRNQQLFIFNVEPLS